MYLSPIMNLIGAVLIVTSIVLHVVCFSTSYWADSSADRIREEATRLIQEHTTATGQDELAQQIMSSGILSTEVHYGLWEFCIEGTIPAVHLDFCAKWASETKVTSSGPESYKVPAWIQGTQAMAIIGILVAVLTAILTAIHLFGRNQGDRLRLLPLFICISAVVTGAFILCGDIIVAVKYNEVVATMVPEGSFSALPQEVQRLIEEIFFLSWGFAIDVVSAVLFIIAGLFIFMANRVESHGGMV